MTVYRVTFNRIGRNHAVPALVAKAVDADDLARHIHRHARPHLRSQDYLVNVDLEAGAGWIACGVHLGGEFTISSDATEKGSAR